MNKFKLIIFIIIFNLIAQSSLANSDLNMFEKEILDLISEYKIPGLSIAIIDDKKILYKKNFGVSSYRTNQKITSKTIWQIASISKTFLAASLGILADKGKFNWDSKVENEIKGFTLKDPIAASKLTFHDIASMQSGLPNAAGREYMEKANKRSDIIKIFKNIQNIYPVGEGYFSYQYGLISLVEQIIENKTKKNWQDFIKEAIFLPLKLSDTGINIDNVQNQNKLAMPHDEYNNELILEKFKVNSAAGFYSNLEDMVKWLQFNMKEGLLGKKQLISIAQIQKIHKKYTPIKNFETQLYKDQNISSIYYSYFWKTLTYNLNYKDIIVYEHNGNCNGMSSIMSYIPKRKIGIIVLSNKFTPVPEIIRSKFIQYFN